jgi:hypothetical protein
MRKTLSPEALKFALAAGVAIEYRPRKSEPWEKLNDYDRGSLKKETADQLRRFYIRYDFRIAQS